MLRIGLYNLFTIWKYVDLDLSGGSQVNKKCITAGSHGSYVTKGCFMAHAPCIRSALGPNALIGQDQSGVDDPGGIFGEPCDDQHRHNPSEKNLADGDRCLWR